MGKNPVVTTEVCDTGIPCDGLAKSSCPDPETTTPPTTETPVTTETSHNETSVTTETTGTTGVTVNTGGGASPHTPSESPDINSETKLKAAVAFIGAILVLFI